MKWADTSEATRVTKTPKMIANVCAGLLACLLCRLTLQ